MNEDDVDPNNVDLVISGTGLSGCLQKIKADEERNKQVKGKKNGKGQEIVKDSRSEDQEDDCENESSLADEFLDALHKNDASKVWELVERNYSSIKRLEDLDKICAAVVEKDNNKERRCNRNGCLLCCGCFECCRCCKDTSANEHQRKSNEQPNNKKNNDEEKRKWIKISSNPLFISVEWLCKTKGQEDVSKDNNNNDNHKEKDIIKCSLDNAYFLEKIASYEHHYSREDYKRAGEACETFAVDVMEGSTSSERYEDQIMDIEGNGCLLTGEPKNFIQSLSLLKIAANRGRKKFVASPRSQFVLNEIIYYKWEDWRDKSTVTKLSWFLLQLVLIAVGTIFYIPIRIYKKICPNMCRSKINWWIESLYEHPYSKFINHTMSYIVFVCLLFTATFGFEDEYRTSTTGLSRIDVGVIVFVVGLTMQELWECGRQGRSLYFSKWWNIVDTITLLIFWSSYLLWVGAWLACGQVWQPRGDLFITADVLYAIATVLAYFHVTHFFQVNSTLGPLQLSLYRMLKDVLKFLLIFFMLYIAFASGVVKVYSYYVASQFRMRDLDNSHYQESHSYAKHENTFIGLIWLLVGYVEEDKIVVDDPAFKMTSTVARIGFVAYLVCTTIVAINMLIAMMNNSFYRLMDDADVEWKFSRAQMWLEWIDKGNAIPVPFNIIYYSVYVLSYMLFVLPCWITRCLKGKGPCCTSKSPRGRTSGETDAEQGIENQASTSEESGADQGRENQNGLSSAETDAEKDEENQTLNCKACFRCCSTPDKSPGDAVRKERMDAITYLVARYLNDRYIPV